MTACSSEWADALTLSVIAICIAAGYIAWRLTGGKHYDERRPRR